MRILTTLMLAMTAAPAFASDSVSLKSEVFVEREVRDAAGATRTELQAPKMVTPGDRLRFVLNYRNAGPTPASDFVVTNPMPTAVAFREGAGAGAAVSVDGGRSWGSLNTLSLRAADGKPRPATAADVTHVRWVLKRIAPGEAGSLKFDGVVR